MKIYVKPKSGLQVRDERGRPIPAEGAEVTRSAYVLRRMRDGDLVEVKPEQPVQAKPRKTKGKE